jgi:hypothetical protein
MPFEFPPALTGSGPAVQVLDPGGAPNTIIQRQDPFVIRTQFSIDQPGASLLGGQWQLRAYVESIGPGQEVQVGTAALNVAAGVPAGGPTVLAGFSQGPVIQVREP